MVYGPVIWQGSVQASSTTLWVLTADQAWEKRPSPFTAWEEAKASDDSRAAITTTLSNLAVRDVAITRVRLFADAVTGDDLHPAGTPRQINCGRIEYYFQTPDGEEVTRALPASLEFRRERTVKLYIEFTDCGPALADTLEFDALSLGVYLGARPEKPVMIDLGVEV